MLRLCRSLVSKVMDSLGFIQFLSLHSYLSNWYILLDIKLNNMKYTKELKKGINYRNIDFIKWFEKLTNYLYDTGPDLTIYYLNRDHPGRCHDANVLSESLLWRSFEDAGNRPFDGAVILGDSAYPLRQWLITPFPGDPDGAKGRFNVSHMRTRNVVERAFGVIKNRFSALKTTLRLKDPKDSANIIESAVILHNLCIRFGDNVEDFIEDEDEAAVDDLPLPEPERRGTAAEFRERRRNQLLMSFQQ